MTWRNRVIEKLRADAAQLEQEKVTEIDFRTYREFMTNGEREAYEQQYFYRRKRVTTFGLMLYVCPHDMHYVSLLENEIWQICNEFTWCLPAHLDPDREEQSYTMYLQTNHLAYTVDLFAAETAFMLAEMVTMYKERLDPFLIDKVAIEVDRRVFTPFKQQTFHWERAAHNWASVCGGSIGAAAIYLIADEEERNSILTRVNETMKYYLSGFQEDGGCTEGYLYWQYGFGFFCYYADLLKKVEPVNLFHDPKVKQIALFQEKIFLSDNHIVNFSDAPPHAAPMIGFTHYLHQQFPEVHLPNKYLARTEIVDHCGRWAPAIRELQWYDDRLQGSDWPKQNYYLKESAIFLSRKKEGSFAVKAGHNEEPHNHNDVGQFILYGKNQVFLRDLGAGQYNKDYFNHNRYQFICNSAEGHSVPVIDGTCQQAGKEYRGHFVEVEQKYDIDRLLMDMSQAYPADVRLLRELKWMHTDQPVLQVMDTFQFNQAPDSLVESFVVADLPYKCKEDMIVLMGEEVNLEILYDRESWEPAIERKDFINHSGEKEYFLHIVFNCNLLQPMIQADITFRIN
ncbi:heparinase II/III-family protein [Gracilibacillus caseinilyticus]|uniref:Heparinase II/III-family protein n=1 Tax=Gracilibacillus caseinilyticus TaxID=2932256 RepID=A0ABY4EX58_9BACI|nr:heparinase II/III family protein [Gracilibacillus caseinilyticus]UOQ48423.1 heparinase II/III-family protein [Gracilibacillus caseinilyticus]